MKIAFRQALVNGVRTHLVLGRVSNLPTVWSNCLAAWALATEVFVWDVFFPTMAFTVTAVTLIYLGGMYLNDALDAPWDAEHKNDRPIPRGEISRPSVFVVGVVLLAAGLALIWFEGWGAFGLAALLVSLVVVYDVYHKRIAWSPLLVAGCRAMVYFIIALTTTKGVNTELVVWALALAGYVVGLSFVAKVEERNFLKRYLPLLLMFGPLILNSYGEVTPGRTALTAIFVAWMSVSLVFVFAPKIRNLRRAVGLMLAGICLVDFLAVSQVADPWIWQAACFGLFLAALAFQRYVPAT